MIHREAILGRISKALGRDGTPVKLAEQPEDVSTRLQATHRHTLPAVGADLVQAAIDNMESVLMSVVRLQTSEECVAAVQWYLESQGIDGKASGAVTVSPGLASMQWPQCYQSGAATGLEQVGVTACIAAVAETGSLVLASGSESPVTLNFLPETHIVVVYESQIVRHVDDVFPDLRQRDKMPRAINFVTGPSRTADIEQTLEIGAHGPRRMHVLLVAGKPGAQYG